MQIILGLIFVIIILAIFLTKSESVTTKSKTAILGFFSLLIAAAVLYEFVFTKQAQSNREIVNTFKQGKTLLCKDTDVNQINFLYESGTQSFMPKIGKKKIIGTIYDIKDCSIKE